MTERSEGGLGARDFFVSYTRADRAWAEWIAWALEEDGHQVLIQAWDFVPGRNWIAGMEAGVRDCARTIAVLSPAYPSSVYGSQEWQAAMAGDPDGTRRRLLVVRVAPCDPPGRLAGVVMVDLFGLAEPAARERLRKMVSDAAAGRAKPTVPPGFPGPGRAVRDEPGFPGRAGPGEDRDAPPRPGERAATGSAGSESSARRPVRLVRTLRGHQPVITGVAQTLNGWLAATGGREAGGARRAGLAGRGVWDVAFSPNGDLLASCGADGNVRLWQAGMGSVHRVLPGDPGPASRVAFNPDGGLLAALRHDGKVQLYRPDTGDLVGLVPDPRQDVRALAFSPDGKTLATGGLDGTIRLWAAPWGARPEALPTVSGPVLGLAVSPEGLLAAASYDTTITIIRPYTGRTEVLRGHTRPVLSVAFSPDGTRLASAGADGLWLWDPANGTRTGQPRFPPTRNFPGGRGLAFSPDGAIVAGAQVRGVVYLWDAVTGEIVSEFFARTVPLSCLAFASAGGLLATGGDSGKVHVWRW